MDRTWMNQMKAGLSVNAAFNQRNALDIGMEMQMLFNDFPVSLKLQPQYRYQYFLSLFEPGRNHESLRRFS